MNRFGADQRRQLLKLAHASIRHGLEHGSEMEVPAGEYEQSLHEQGACFITLKRGGELRGCIGSLEAYRPLLEDIVHNAFAAAFRDPRFPPLNQSEYTDLELQISVLSPPEPMQVSDEADLLAQLRPGVDGLVLREGAHRATFLPAVWEQLPDRRNFLTHLKYKAGLPAEFWSEDLQISRYTTESFGEGAG